MALAMPLGFFSLSGVLQAYAAAVANRCGLPANQLVTWLGYLHLCAQPFFINAVALHFIDRRVASRIDLYAFTLCFTGMTFMLIQGYPFAWAGQCAPGTLMCAEQLCTLQDSWALAWLVPLTQYPESTPWYFLCAYAMPLLYGAWRFTLVFFACCPALAFIIAPDMNIWPMLSASFSVCFLIVLAASAGFRHSLVTRNWLGWRMIQAGY